MNNKPSYEELEKRVRELERVETEFKLADNKFDKLIRYEHGIAECIVELAKSSDNTCLSSVLEKLREVADVSRTYIFKNEVVDGKLCMSQTFESCAEGVEPQIDNPELQELPYEFGAPELLGNFESGKPFGGIVANLSDPTREVLESQGILSVLILPIYSANKLYGFIGFDDCKKKREWDKNDIYVLKSVAETIGSSINRWQTGEALEFERAQLLSIFDSIEESIYVSDPETHEILYANRYLKNSFNKELIGGICYEELQNLTAPCEFCTNKIILRNKPDSYRWEYHNPITNRCYTINDRIIKWPDGRDVRFELAIDVTEFKRIEEALKKNTQRTELAIEGGELGTWDWNAETGVLALNNRWAEILGFELDEVEPTVQFWKNLIHRDDYSAVMKALNDHVEGRTELYESEHRLKNKFGEWVWVQDKGRVVEREDNGKAKRVCGTLMDITPRKVAEINLQYRSRFERLVAEIASELAGVNRDSIDEALNHALKSIGSFIGADRVYMFRFISETRIENSHEWCAENIEAQIDNLKDIELDNELPWFARQIRNREIIKIDDVSGMSSESGLEKEHFEAQNIKSLLVIPMLVTGQLVGFIGFDSVEAKRAWSDDDISLLKFISETVSHVIERSWMEDKIHQSESRMRTIIDTIPDLVWLKDLNGVYLACNQRFERFFGAPEEVIAGKTDYDFVDKELADLFREKDRLAITVGKPCMNEEDIVYADDGHPETIETIKTPMFDLRGEMTGVLGIARDITHRKQAEAERERLLSAIEQVTEAIVITDTDGNIQYTNSAFEKITGYSSGEVQGFNPRILQSGRHNEAFYREMWETLLQGEAWRGRFINKRKDGQLYTEEAIISPARDNSGKITNFVAVKRDITNELNQEEQLRQAQKMESVGRLAGGVAHDFNNMLSVIIGHTDIALSQIEPDNVFREDFEEIQKAAKRSADITRQLLAFARKQTIAPTIIDLSQSIESALKMLGPLLGEDIELIWQPAKAACKIKMDQAQIDQIIANLLVNARDAISGVGKIIVETSIVTMDEQYCVDHPGFAPGQYVQLTVSDNGCGMDDETKSKLFEPFYSTKGPLEGTGLGLSTVYGIIKQNMGFINVYSELGKGTTFKILLKHYTGDRIEVKNSDKSDISSGGKETILLVEDEEAIMKLGRTMLERLGYGVLAASTPEEAISLAKKYKEDIDLLITDVVMPEMNGKNLARTILSFYPDLKCLFMSGYTADVIAHQGILDEGVQFMQKPFSMRELASKVRLVLDS